MHVNMKLLVQSFGHCSQLMTAEAQEKRPGDVFLWTRSLHYISVAAMSSHHKHQNHWTLVDVVCVDACSFPEPTPDIHKEKKGILNKTTKQQGHVFTEML